MGSESDISSIIIDSEDCRVSLDVSILKEVSLLLILSVKMLTFSYSFSLSYMNEFLVN